MEQLVDPGKFNDILLVDDMPENLQLLGNILSLKGFQVSFASNGVQALEAISYDPPDLILLDIFMPELDGFEVCRQLKQGELTKDIPIIFLTANSDLEGIIKAFELGAVDYVTKPFNATELVTRVFTHLELSKTKRIAAMQNELLLKQNLELQKLNITKDKFFSVIAKDLKNPMNNLIGYSEMLVNSFDNMEAEKVKKLHHTLYSSAKLAYNVLDDLLLWSKLQTGAISLRAIDFPIREAIDESVQIVNNAAQTKQIHLQIESMISHQVYADKFTIKTLIRNLLSNAIKFTPRHGIVKIRTSEKENFILIEIEDTGIGMSRDLVETLFTLDHAQTTPGTEKEGGTGLGLIVCAEIVKKNKGRISVKSTPGIGSIFYIELPKLI